MFELYDFIRWDLQNGGEIYARYWYFMKICEDEILRLGLDLDTIPVYTNNENFVSRWFYLEGKFKNIQDMQKLLDYDSYRIILLRGQIIVRGKSHGKKNSSNK